MARPIKKGLDYFPFDVDFFTDPKIRVLKSRYGADGITLYMYLLCEIYKNGYYLKTDNDYWFILVDDLRMNINKVRQILNFLLERSLFDKTLFQSDKVLTSTGIQERFQCAVKERAKKTPISIKDFWLLPEERTESFLKVNPKKNNSENNESNSKNNESNSKNNETKERKSNQNNISKARNQFTEYPQRNYDAEYFKNIEKILLAKG